VFGEESKICLARELTKKFEEFIRGTIKEVFTDIKNRKNLIGEFVVLIYSKEDTEKEID
jgi:16S rRNA (cytidine1402-2'-O)-methyltransferase